MGKEAGGRHIVTERDAKKIKDPVERAFAYFLLRRGKGRFVIIHEPQLFKCDDGGGGQIGTVPDFYIRKQGSQITGGAYVEITRSERTEPDPKEKQRRVMRESAPREKYVVLYGGNLENIQKAHPWFLFSHGNGKNASNGN